MKTLSLGGLCLAGALLLAAPLAMPPDLVGLLSKVLIATIFASSFSLLVGQGGMLSFGHAAYFAVGCFAAIHAMNAQLLPTPLLPIVGGIAGLLLGVLAGYFATMRSGVYFSMVTLAIAELLHTMAPNLQSVFGGESGISSIRRPWMGISFGSELEVYYLVLAWTAATLALLWLYSQTLFGRLTVATKENERRVAFLGYDVHMAKLLVFSVSALFAGIAGGLLAVVSESANYVLFALKTSADVVLQSFIGGVGTFLGPSLGAAILTFFGHSVSGLTRQWVLYQGVVFIIVMMYAPKGIGGLVSDGMQRLQAGRLVTSWPSVALRLLGALLLAAGAVFLCEMGAAIMTRDYQGRLQNTGIWAPVNIFGNRWAPDSVLPWLAATASFLAGCVLLTSNSLGRLGSAGRVAVAGSSR